MMTTNHQMDFMKENSLKNYYAGLSEQVLLKTLSDLEKKDILQEGIADNIHCIKCVLIMKHGH